MVAKNPAETDDQIIDLTELIEKGEVPANDSSAQAQHVETEQETLQKHLHNLNDGSAPADAAIDDLLAQMDKKENAQQDDDVALDFSAPSTQTDHPIDPNEELHMPGMGDVDNLLNSLDIPPQPGERDATAAPEEADKAVDSLLSDVATAPAAPSSAAPQAGAPDLDELLSSVGQTQPPMEPSAIDDLLREGLAETAAAQPTAAEQTQPQTPPAPQKRAATFSNDELDSLLAAANVEPSHSAPQGAASDAAAPKPAPAPKADVQPEMPAPQPAQTAQPAAGATDGPDAVMDMDIDSLLAAAANDLETAAQPEVQPEPQAVSQPAQAAQPTATAEPSPVAAAAPQAPQPAMPVDIDSLLAAAANAPETTPEAPLTQATGVAAPAPEADDAMGPEFEALLAAAAEELTTQTPPETADEIPGEALDAAQTVAPEGQPDAALPDDLRADFDALTEEPAPQTPPVESAAPVTEGVTLAAVMAQASEASSHAVDAFEQAFEASTRAADAADAVAGLSARVEQCEQALQEAGERIIALETALEAQIAAVQELTAAALPRQELENLFAEDHPLHQRLAALVADAVARALPTDPAPQADPEASQAVVDEQLQPVVTATRSIAARMDALEARLDELEPRFNDRVEKAAAGAAARILREEIGRLLEDQ